MKLMPRLSAWTRCAFRLIAPLTLFLLYPCSVNAQPAPVPAAFQDLYDTLHADLGAFNTTLNGLWNGSKYPAAFAGNLNNANANGGQKMLSSGSGSGYQFELQALKAMGVQAAVVQVGFPMLYQPFFTYIGQPQMYAQFVAYYQTVAQDVRAAGLKLIVENDVLLSNDVSANWNVAAYYASLDWKAFQAARAQGALEVAQTLQPDYLVVLEQPDSQATQTGQSNVNTATGAASLVSQMLASLAPVRGAVKVGAGVGTAQVGFQDFVQGFVALPLDFIDMHVYPINALEAPSNSDFLANALTIANMAKAAGKPVTVSEAWLWKMRNSEWNVLSPSEIRARNPFSFWAPLDAYFIQTLENLANYTQMPFMAPEGPLYFWAYQTYDDDTANMPPSEILARETTLANQANQTATYTSTGMSYYGSLVSPPDMLPPAIPTITQANSGSGTAASLSWTSSADNVGAAGYYLWRDGVPLPTTAMTQLKDSGLTNNTTYTYQVAAFDLGGNVSAPATVSITTKNTTPPNPPTNVAGVAISCQQANLTWTPPTGNVKISSYLVFRGTSSANLAQIQQLNSSATSFSNYKLTPGTTYYYGIKAKANSNLTSPMSNIAVVTTLAPPTAPTNLVATALSSTKVSLTWSPSTGGMPIASYRIYRGTSRTNLSQVAVRSTTSYTDTTVTAKTTYYYAVQAADTGGDLSPMSATVSVTTP